MLALLAHGISLRSCAAEDAAILRTVSATLAAAVSMRQRMTDGCLL